MVSLDRKAFIFVCTAPPHGIPSHSHTHSNKVLKSYFCFYKYCMQVILTDLPMSNPTPGAFANNIFFGFNPTLPSSRYMHS